MAEDPPINKVRYAKRVIDDDGWIRAFLQRMASGFLATAHENQPYVIPVQYVYDEQRHAIYLHGARAGRKYENIAANAQVCFSVGEMGRMLPESRAAKFGVEYASVVIFGQASVIEDNRLAHDALQMLLDKYAPHLRPGRDYEPITEGDLERTAVLEIRIDSWSAKMRAADPDYPGAYLFGEAAP